MDKETAKRKAMEAIDKNAERLKEYAEDIWAHPELGFKEFRTADKVMEFFDELGLEYESGIARTGVRADVKGASSDVRIAIMGELDGVTCPEHPDSDPETGAVHACGHFGQQTVMLGTAVGLIKTGIAEQLAGDLAFIAVPAEEFIELA
ncbi:MAG: amidohydrolase, partial [Bacillota bacterium]